MAKQRFQGASMSTIIDHKEFHTAAKIELYCKRNFGMSFMAKMEERISQVRKEFTENILEQIVKAEEIYGKDYTEIEE